MIFGGRLNFGAVSIKVAHISSSSMKTKFQISSTKLQINLNIQSAISETRAFTLSIGKIDSELVSGLL